MTAPLSPVQRAAMWLASTPPEQRPSNAIGYIRAEFGLSAVQAAEACRMAAEIRRSTDFGGAIERLIR